MCRNGDKYLKCVVIDVEGVLKGLGFLGYVYVVAEELKLRGWARYREGGSVEIVAVGDEENLMKFIERLKFHDFLAIVNNVDVKPCPRDIAVNLNSFELIFS